MKVNNAWTKWIKTFKVNANTARQPAKDVPTCFLKKGSNVGVKKERAAITNMFANAAYKVIQH